MALVPCAFGRCGHVEDGLLGLILSLLVLLWTRGARGFCKALSKSLVCSRSDFFGCHGTVGFPGIVDGFADLGFGLFLFAETFCCCCGFGDQIDLSMAGEVRTESALARCTALRSCSRDG